MESNIIIPALVQKYDELNESLNHQIAENEKLQASNIEKTRDLNFCIQRITELDEEEKLISLVNSLRHSLTEKANQDRTQAKSMPHFEFRESPESLKIAFSSEAHFPGPEKIFPSRRFAKGRRKNKPMAS